jgi:hypothetical protein
MQLVVVRFRLVCGLVQELFEINFMGEFVSIVDLKRCESTYSDHKYLMDMNITLTMASLCMSYSKRFS